MLLYLKNSYFDAIKMKPSLRARFSRGRRSHPLSQRRTRSSPALAERPAWDSTVTDLSRYRSSDRETLQRKLAAISPNNSLAAAELHRRLGPEVVSRLFGACIRTFGQHHCRRSDGDA